MTLEELLSKNIEATTRLATAVEAQTSHLKSLGGGAKPATTAGTGKTAAAGPATKPKAPTSEDLAAKANDYLNSIDRETAKGNIKRISEKFSAPRFTAIPEANRQEALDLLAQFVAGEDPLADDSGV